MEKSLACRNCHFGLVWPDLRGASVRGTECDCCPASGQRIDGGLLGMLET